MRIYKHVTSDETAWVVARDKGEALGEIHRYLFDLFGEDEEEWVDDQVLGSEMHEATDEELDEIRKDDEGKDWTLRGTLSNWSEDAAVPQIIASNQW